uniref:BTB domain-containing protein n=1 Tax=Panagrolaimus davidi TaxID=227884 RepID=A0A914R459_9BILA
MDSLQNYSFELLQKRLRVFKANDPENFDVVFKIRQKKLYAYNSELCTHSNIFKAFFSENRNSNESVKIQNFSFKDFKDFITFIYSGECSFTYKNIFTKINIAEFYKVEIFKKACEQFLLKVEGNFKNVFEILENAKEYSMDDHKKSILVDFVPKNSLNFVQSSEFQGFSKSLMYDIVKSNENAVRQEEDSELIEIITQEFSDILPSFKFHKMKNEFLIKFKRNSIAETDILLAEMVTEYGFELKKWKFVKISYFCL